MLSTRSSDKDTVNNLRDPLPNISQSFSELVYKSRALREVAARQTTDFVSRNNPHRLPAICPPRAASSCPVRREQTEVWQISPQYGCWNVALRWCRVVTFDGRSLGRLRWLCVEDDLWDLSVFYWSAVVVARRVAEGEAGLCAGGGWLMCYLSHSLGPIMRVWTLSDTHTEQDE